MEAQTSARVRAALIDVIPNPAPVAALDEAFARHIRHATVESELGAAYAAGAEQL